MDRVFVYVIFLRFGRAVRTFLSILRLKGVLGCYLGGSLGWTCHFHLRRTGSAPSANKGPGPLCYAWATLPTSPDPRTFPLPRDPWSLQNGKGAETLYVWPQQLDHGSLGRFPHQGLGGWKGSPLHSEVQLCGPEGLFPLTFPFPLRKGFRTLGIPGGEVGKGRRAPGKTLPFHRWTRVPAILCQQSCQVFWDHKLSVCPPTCRNVDALPEGTLRRKSN